MKKKCPHCYPVEAHPWHLFDRFESWILRMIRPIDLAREKFPRAYMLVERTLFTIFLKLLRTSRLLQEFEIPEQGRIPNRSWVVIKEAQQRGAKITALCLGPRRRTTQRPPKFFCYYPAADRGCDKPLTFEVLPHIDIKHNNQQIDDKEYLRQLLRRYKLPYPEGRVFRALQKGVQYGEVVGYPLVVKPRLGSLSKHTTINIRDHQALTAAIRVAKKISAEYVVEKFIPGDVHRVVVVDGELVAVARRLPPNVIGDGVHTITELIKIKNTQHGRGPANDPTATLHTIEITPRTEQFLVAQNLTLDSILPQNRRVYLSEKLMLASGADIHDLTAAIHRENAAMFLATFALCQLEIVGFDFICADITQPYYTQHSAIIEANSLPYIDMHHFPSAGTPQNVAAKIMDYVEKKFIKL